MGCVSRDEKAHSRFAQISPGFSLDLEYAASAFLL
jgi:hypothetical protein